MLYLKKLYLKTVGQCDHHIPNYSDQTVQLYVHILIMIIFELIHYLRDIM